MMLKLTSWPGDEGGQYTSGRLNGRARPARELSLQEHGGGHFTGAKALRHFGPKLRLKQIALFTLLLEHTMS